MKGLLQHRTGGAGGWLGGSKWAWCMSTWCNGSAHGMDTNSNCLRAGWLVHHVVVNVAAAELCHCSCMGNANSLKHCTSRFLYTGKGGELAGEADKRNAVEVYGLKKQYDGNSGCFGHSMKCCSACDCCSCEVIPSFWPIKGSWFSIPENHLFCLLGPNGAGKTTTINCLTGKSHTIKVEGLADAMLCYGSTRVRYDMTCWSRVSAKGKGTPQSVCMLGVQKHQRSSSTGHTTPEDRCYPAGGALQVSCPPPTVML